MAYNKKHSKTPSIQIHASKARTSTRNNHKPNFCAKTIILTVIILTFLVVIIAVICSLIFTPETITKSNLNKLATDYYENYYYESIVNSKEFNALDNVDSTMEKYTEKGFPKIKLRQLILQNQSRNQPLTDQIIKYCDEESTFVTFYPELPFDRTSYHIEFDYSCLF